MTNTISINDRLGPGGLENVATLSTDANGNTVLVGADGAVLSLRYQLCSTAIPFVIPSSGSIGNNGALTGITALPQVYSSGCYLYFPANAIVAGSAAGLYYTVMSSGTAGTIYNNIYTGGVPSIPATPVAFATTGPGAYTQTTAADITMLSITVPAGLMGTNGALQVFPSWEYPNNANAKTNKTNLGAGNLLTYVATTTAAITQWITARNRGVANRQVLSAPSGNGVGTPATYTSNLSVLSIDTAVDQTLAFTGQLAVATDYLILDGVIAEALPF